MSKMKLMVVIAALAFAGCGHSKSAAKADKPGSEMKSSTGEGHEEMKEGKEGADGDTDGKDNDHDGDDEKNESGGESK